MKRVLNGAAFEEKNLQLRSENSCCTFIFSEFFKHFKPPSSYSKGWFWEEGQCDFFCRWRKWGRNIQNLFVCLFRLWPDTQQQRSLLRQPLISYSQPPAASFIVLAHLSVWMCSEPVTGNDSDEKSCSIFRSRAVLVKVDIKWQPCHDTRGRWIFFN